MKRIKMAIKLFRAAYIERKNGNSWWKIEFWLAKQIILGKGYMK